MEQDSRMQRNNRMDECLTPTRRVLHREYEARLTSPRDILKYVNENNDTNTITPLKTKCRVIQSTKDVEQIYSKTSNNPIKRKLHDIYSDRYIPSQSGSQVNNGFCLLPDPPKRKSICTYNTSIENYFNTSYPKETSTLTKLLQSELLGVNMPIYSTQRQRSGVYVLSSNPGNILRYKSARKSLHDDIQKCFTSSPLRCNISRYYTDTSIGRRQISKIPIKVLDAPALQDDFYLNLVDWSATNILAVGLGACVYLWNASTSKVTKLFDLGTNDAVTSVVWSQRGNYLTIGTNTGEVQVWDTIAGKLIRTMGGHVARVGTIAWNSQIMASGSRDRSIFLRDIRCPNPFQTKLSGHKQEICGLKWSFDDQQLASGGNDNKLFIWNQHRSTPMFKFHDHNAAVKAIAWSPHQPGLVASGGGTADRCIRFYNTLTGKLTQSMDTGSQVCNLIWSKNVNEVVSTHGYSLNQIIVWKYPLMTKMVTLTGHSYRVLYLAMSPDGQTIVTGAGDETLRFWNVFPSVIVPNGTRLGLTTLGSTSRSNTIR